MTNDAVGRRNVLTSAAPAIIVGAIAIAEAPLAHGAEAQPQPQPRGSDADIYRFALNLEYMEAEYYTLASTGRGLGPADIGPNPGAVNGGRRVAFSNPVLEGFAQELAANETAHVRFLRATLGASGAIPRPPVDFRAGFAQLAEAAGLGADFDAFQNETTFFLGSMVFEDVGITAYKGAAPLLQDKEVLKAAAGILAVEAYHMGMTRSVLYRMGPRARGAANRISDARDRLDGPADLDQGVELNGRANVVPADANGIVFSRTPQQVLRIVYGTDRPGVAGGGFFPAGVNGALRGT